MVIQPKFYLKDARASGKTSIQLRVYINQKMLRYGIGASIYPALWDDDLQRPVKATQRIIRPFKSKDPNIKIELENVKTRIDFVVSTLNNLLVQYGKTGEKIDFISLKEDLNRKVKDIGHKITEVKNRPTLNQYIDDFIEELENGKTYTTNSGKELKYQASTIKVYREWRTQFLAFQKHIKRQIDFDDITLGEFYPAYKNYFLKKDYSTNSTGKQIKIIKAIMRMSLDDDLHRNIDFQKRAFRTLKTEVDEIYLSEKEVLDIYKLDLSNEPHLELARDVFVIGCFTALRFSDYSRIRPIHIKETDGTRYLDIKTQKTGERVIIPLRPEVVSILEKYEYSLPKTYEQKLNKGIKIIGKRAEISELTQVNKEKGGAKVNTELPKYELIKSHTARRTGATLMYKAGIPLQEIMLITGHKKESSLKKYLKFDKLENAESLKLNPFFSGS